MISTQTNKISEGAKQALSKLMIELIERNVNTSVHKLSDGIAVVSGTNELYIITMKGEVLGVKVDRHIAEEASLVSMSTLELLQRIQ